MAVQLRYIGGRRPGTLGLSSPQGSSTLLAWRWWYADMVPGVRLLVLTSPLPFAPLPPCSPEQQRGQGACEDAAVRQGDGAVQARGWLVSWMWVLLALASIARARVHEGRPACCSLAAVLSGVQG